MQTLLQFLSWLESQNISLKAEGGWPIPESNEELIERFQNRKTKTTAHWSSPEKGAITHYLSVRDINHPCGFIASHYDEDQEETYFEANSYIFQAGYGECSNHEKKRFGFFDEAKTWLLEKLLENARQYYPNLEIELPA